MNRFKGVYEKSFSYIRARKDSPTSIAVFASLSSILVGILFGLILMIILNPLNAFYGFLQLVTSGFTSLRKMGDVLYTSAPLIMTGLAVGFSFKTGLFNIGASGQYLVGAFFALFAGIVLKLPWWLALLLAGVGGALWGAIPGIFKAYFNVNEVITCIMFNWIGLFIVNLLIGNTPKLLKNYYWPEDVANRTPNLDQVNPGAIIPKLGMDRLFSDRTNIAIFIAIFFAIIVHILLNKTTFGYELKACGFNRNASKYAGINEKRNIVLSMIISGALAGIGGGIYYLTGVANYSIETVLPSNGFNGIPVALLATSSPIATIFSGLFIAYTTVGGNAMQPEFAKEVADIIIAVIIYISAFSLLFKQLIAKRIKRKKTETEAQNIHNANELIKEEK